MIYFMRCARVRPYPGPHRRTTRPFRITWSKETLHFCGQTKPLLTGPELNLCNRFLFRAGSQLKIGSPSHVHVNRTPTMQLPKGGALQLQCYLMLQRNLRKHTGRTTRKATRPLNLFMLYIVQSGGRGTIIYISSR